MIFHHVNKLLRTQMETRSAFPMAKARNMWIKIFWFKSLRNQRAFVTSSQGLSHSGTRCVSLSHEKLSDWWRDILSSDASSLWSAFVRAAANDLKSINTRDSIENTFPRDVEMQWHMCRAFALWPQCTNYMQETDVINDGFVHRSK